MAFPSVDPPEAYVFRGWTLDLRRHTLLKDGREHHLRVKAYDVLVYLARHAERVVGKQELLDAVWGDVAVTEDSLVQCLMEIRRVLGDEQSVVRTVRGRGYLLDARVETRRLAPATVSTFPAPPGGSPAAVTLVDHGLPGDRDEAGRASTRQSRSRLIAAVAVTLAIAIASIAWLARHRADVGTIRLTSQQTLNPEAAQAFDEGMRIRDRLSQTDLQRARQLFARAATLDPGFAAAHAAHAFQLEVLSAFGVERPTDVLPQALVAARRAVELDPTLPAAWTALAHGLVQGEWDWVGAEAAYRRAIALDPEDPHARFLLAHLLMGIGRTSEGLAESFRARALRPREARFTASNGILLYWNRQHDASRQAFADALALNDRNSLPRFWMALNEVASGDLDAAMTLALAARQGMGNPPTWIVGYVHGIAGRRTEALEVLHALEAQRARTYVPAVDIAFLHIGLGDLEAALDWLETGLRERSRWMEILAALPVVDPLRDHPRFKAILRTLDLPDEVAPVRSAS